MFPRPIETLKPIVQCCGIEHNTLVREGRGFTKQEIAACNLCPQRARQLGIAVDYRRVNKTQQSLDRNVARIKEYLSRLEFFPRGTKREEIKKAVQVRKPMPITNPKPEITIANIAD